MTQNGLPHCGNEECLGKSTIVSALVRALYVEGYIATNYPSIEPLKPTPLFSTFQVTPCLLSPVGCLLYIQTKVAQPIYIFTYFFPPILQPPRYAKYLNDVLGHFKLDVREQTNVLDITPALKDGEKVQIKTDKGDFSCLFIVWAGGEFHYPKSIPHTIRVGHGTL